MDYLTVEQVIAFHEQVIKTDGGDGRLLSEACLHQMVFSANCIDDVPKRAAYVFFSLCAYPAFREGNCGTARLVSEFILSDSGYTLEKSGADITDLVQGIASFTVEQAEIEDWLRSHYKKTVK